MHIWIRVSFLKRKIKHRQWHNDRITRRIHKKSQSKLQFYYAKKKLSINVKQFGWILIVKISVLMYVYWQEWFFRNKAAHFVSRHSLINMGGKMRRMCIKTFGRCRLLVSLIGLWAVWLQFGILKNGKKVPITVGKRKKVPITVGKRKKVPITVGKRKKVPTSRSTYGSHT